MLRHRDPAPTTMAAARLRPSGARRWLRPALLLIAALLAAAWLAVFVLSQRAGLELLVLFSPLAFAFWLVISLTAARRTARRRTVATAPPQTGEVAAAVLARDGHVCRFCGADGADRVVARRPAGPAETDPLARFVTLCRPCAATSALPEAGA